MVFKVWLIGCLDGICADLSLGNGEGVLGPRDRSSEHDRNLGACNLVVIDAMM